MRTSETTSAILPAFYAAYGEMPPVEKSQQVNGAGRYPYADFNDYLRSVYRPLRDNGLIMTFGAVGCPGYERLTSEKNDNGRTKTILGYACHVGVTCRVTHVESGEWIEADGWGDGYDTQDKAIGKAQTYAKKYALGLLFGLPCEDDTDHRPSPSRDEARRRQEESNEIRIGKVVEGYRTRLAKCANADQFNKVTNEARKEPNEGNLLGLLGNEILKRAKEMGLEKSPSGEYVTTEREPGEEG